MPNRPTRPGKHAAPRQADPALARAAHRLTSTLRPLGPRRTGGTVVALGAVVLAGAAGGNGSGASVSTDTSAPPRAAMDVPATADAAANDRAAAAGEASRSQARGPLTQERDHGGSADVSSGGVARAKSVVPADPRKIAQQMIVEYGWDSGEFSCLDQLWVSESAWDVDATNPTSGAYGIPQSLPPEKMAAAGPDWRTNPATQIEWGLEYIDLSYGTPCSAWEFKQANNWY